MAASDPIFRKPANIQQTFAHISTGSYPNGTKGYKIEKKNPLAPLRKGRFRSSGFHESSNSLKKLVWRNPITNLTETGRKFYKHMKYLT
jgi:hypothetical protein